MIQFDEHFSVGLKLRNSFLIGQNYDFLSPFFSSSVRRPIRKKRDDSHRWHGEKDVLNGCAFLVIEQTDYSKTGGWWCFWNSVSSKQPQTLSKQNRLGRVWVSNSKMIKQWISNCTNEWSKTYPWLVPMSMKRGAFLFKFRGFFGVRSGFSARFMWFVQLAFLGVFLKHQPPFRDLNWW